MRRTADVEWGWTLQTFLLCPSATNDRTKTLLPQCYAFDLGIPLLIANNY